MNDFNDKTIPEKKNTDVRFTSGYSEEALPFAKPEKEDGCQNPTVIPVRQSDEAEEKEPSVPEQIRSMRSIAPDYTRFPYSKNLHFYRQGKWMENYEEDSYVYHGRFSRYFPTYQTMNNDQLRGYFAWRTGVRRFLTRLRENTAQNGSPTDAADPDRSAAAIRAAAEAIPDDLQLFDTEQYLSFLYLWIYELISGIGVTNEDGFLNLRIADALAGSQDARLRSHLRRWTADYVIYCGLDRSLILPYFHTDMDEAMENAGHFERAIAAAEPSADFFPEFSSVHPMFAALNTLSKTDLTRSPLYRQYPEDVERAALHVYRAICLFYQKNGKPMLLEQSFGGRGIYPYRIFDAAVFYDYKHYADYTYEVDRAHIFRCTNGVWRCEKYLISDEKSRTIGMIFHETDCILRARLHFGHPLKSQMRSSVMASIVADAVDEYLARKREALRPKVHIDPAHLASIRSDAAKTRDRLITSEEMEAEEAPEAILPSPPQHSALLTDEQTEFLRLLLSGDGWADFVSAHHLTLSIFIDEINETLYDEIGDTVIDTSGGEPAIIEDYRPDLDALLHT
jgi:hypothetical protein